LNAVFQIEQKESQPIFGGHSRAGFFKKRLIIEILPSQEIPRHSTYIKSFLKQK
jgi:hypothetical protein